ncbi:MAG: DEAD/DEAH box helicase [Deltaproteobacteria bacterium]|nr:DEAD/DEAH box helicase [Deltaproteobacteria bacterium]
MSGFSELKLIAPILNAVHAQGYETPTPIQQKAIPIVLSRTDLLGCAQTGTGKTAAFALPILQLLSEKGQGAAPNRPRAIRCLILTPTRELASQIGESFAAYGRDLPIRGTVIFGGVGQRPQENALRNGIDVVVATPGRLLDLMQQRLVNLNALEIFVLDEADRMLDMGFIHDVRRIIAALPKKRQTLFFSATMPPEISRLAEQILTRPTRIEVAPPATTVELIDQALYQVNSNQKTSLLIHLLRDAGISRSLVFTRTKRDANRVAESLSDFGIASEAIHGNKSQSARERALANIKSGRTRVLVATDIAARGIDIDSVTHVFNYDIPNVPESYVHRIGRTARAGQVGSAVAFCAPEERGFLADIERVIRKRVPVLKTPLGLGIESRGNSGGGGRRPRGNSGRRFGGGRGRPQGASRQA